MIHRNPRSAAHGFTLIEVMSALLLMAVIIGMVLAIARSSLHLSQAIVDSQAEEMKQQAFFDLLSRRFSSLPGNAVFNLKVEDTGSRYLSTLTIQNAPMNFSWGGQDRVAKAVTLSTVPRLNGYVDVVLGFYENEVLEGTTDAFDKKSTVDEGPFAEIVLMEEVAYFEWQVYNPATQEWQYEWDENGRLPLQLELVMAIGAKGQEMKQMFWLPPKQNPELLMRQLAAPGGPTHFETRETGVKLEVDSSSLTPNQGGGQ